jgi:hypothetical protein
VPEERRTILACRRLSSIRPPRPPLARPSARPAKHCTGRRHCSDVATARYGTIILNHNLHYPRSKLGSPWTREAKTKKTANLDIVVSRSICLMVVVIVVVAFHHIVIFARTLSAAQFLVTNGKGRKQTHET